MSKPINKGWVALTTTRVISIILAVFAVVLLIGAISLFHDSSQYVTSSNAYPNTAEDQPYGLDALGASFAGGFGLVFLVASIVLFIIALLMFIGTSRKLKKKAALAKQQLENQGTTPDTQQTITSSQVPQQTSTVTGIATHEASDNDQQRGVS